MMSLYDKERDIDRKGSTLWKSGAVYVVPGGFGQCNVVIFSMVTSPEDNTAHVHVHLLLCYYYNYDITIVIIT